MLRRAATCAFRLAHIRPLTSILSRTPASHPVGTVYGQVQSRWMATAAGAPGMGFSYPGPRKLSEITKLQLLDKHTASGVTHIWREFHTKHKSAVADVLDADAYRLFTMRTKRCPLFVLPVPRDGGYFTLLVQFQGRQVFLTFLEDYKRNTAAAMPYLTVTFFEEFVVTKGIALVRAEVTNMVTTAEAKVLLELIKRFYLGEGREGYDAVVAFNTQPEKFDFKTVLRVSGIASA